MVVAAAEAGEHAGEDEDKVAGQKADQRQHQHPERKEPAEEVGPHEHPGQRQQPVEGIHEETEAGGAEQEVEVQQSTRATRAQKVMVLAQVDQISLQVALDPAAPLADPGRNAGDRLLPGG